MKTGQPRDSDQVQVLTYMYAAPLAFPQFKGKLVDGAVVYHNHQVSIPYDAVSKGFKDSLVGLIRRLADDEPARRVPSSVECGYCEITKTDSQDRVEVGQ